MMRTEESMKKARDHTEIGALIALFVGAVTVGAAGILVRLAETGPMATAFWRGLFALPLLAVWAMLESPARPARAEAERGGDAAARRLVGASGWRLLLFFRDRGFLVAGAFFAGDLALWHESLLLTSVAAATLEACLAPLAVVLFAWLAWKERPTTAFLVAIALAILGMVLIVSPKLGHGGSALLGDAFGLATAVFFAGYILAVAHLRGRYGTGIVMFNSTVVFTVLLLPLALSQKFLPNTAGGWAAVIGYAVAAHALGQGLIAYALAHLRPAFGSLGLLVETFGAAVSAWVVLGERLAPVQIVGGLVIVGGIALARSARAAEPAVGAAEALAAGALPPALVVAADATPSSSAREVAPTVAVKSAGVAGD
jgi:drug/metabolite transporter (DMT)-like permease